VLSSIYKEDFKPATKDEDVTGTDGFIKNRQIQIKAGEISQEESEQIMSEGKLLIEVHYNFSYGGNRVLVFNRKETALLQQKDEIKKIIESYILKNESVCKVEEIVF
jgi:hypothetical protein